MSPSLCHPVPSPMLSPPSRAGSVLFFLPTLYPQESLILLFIPLEHLHANPFYLRRCCLWSERFAVRLAAQAVSGGALEMKIRGSSSLHEVLMQKQSKPSISLFINHLLTECKHLAFTLGALCDAPFVCSLVVLLAPHLLPMVQPLPAFLQGLPGCV